MECYILVRNNEFKWSILGDESVEIQVVNKGIFNKIAQILFRAPKISKIKLDEYGSTVWKEIDDNRDIAIKVRGNFEDDENVFYERLVKFFSHIKRK